MASTTYVRAGLAMAAAAALLTTSTSGYAAWQTAHESAADAGPSLEGGATTVTVTSPGGDPREVDARNGVRAVVGDTVTVAVPVTIRTGGAPSARLRVEVPAAGGDPALAKALLSTPARSTFSPVDGGPALGEVPDDAMARTVPAAADGHTYVVRWSTSTRPTRDGKKPGRSNTWGAGPQSLQGLSVGTRPLGVVLTAGAAASTPPATDEESRVRTVVPAITMETTALRVATAPGGSALSTLGGIPVRVRPVSVQMSPLGPLTESEMGTLLDRAGVDILWGEDDCSDVRWAVTAKDVDESFTARPSTSGEETETLPPGEQRRLCTRLTSSMKQDELVQRFAGRRMLAATQWSSASMPPSTWSSTAATKAVIGVPLPSAQPASTDACTPTRGGVTLRWAWPTAGSTPSTGADGIDRWTVNARPVGGSAWTRVSVRPGADARDGVVTAAALRKAGVRPGNVELMVRAYPYAGAEDVHADSAAVWTATLPAEGAVTCTGTAPNSGRLVELGDDR